MAPASPTMTTASRSLASSRVPTSAFAPAPRRGASLASPGLCQGLAKSSPTSATTISSSSFARSSSSRSSSSVLVRSMAQQEKAAAANESRWQAQVREGRVKSVSAKTAGELMKSGEGWYLLDVRPPSEVARAAVKGAVCAPLYVPESFDSLPNLMKHASWFGMGGWWLGGVHMKPNPDFMAAVRSAVPEDAKLVVACQKGLRSLAAAEQLARAGFGELAWINGGLDTAARGDLEVEGPDGVDDLRYAGIGGMSEVLGMTAVQKDKKKGSSSSSSSPGSIGESLDPLVKGALVVLALDSVWFVWGQVAGK